MFHANPQRTGTTSEIVTPPLILKWKYETEGSSFGDPVVSGGIVYVSSGDNRVQPPRGALHALDASTGALRWSYTTRSYVYDPTVSGGVVYVG
jgi:outer membrane protein assembly factor BamB